METVLSVGRAGRFAELRSELAAHFTNDEVSQRAFLAWLEDLRFLGPLLAADASPQISGALRAWLRGSDPAKTIFLDSAAALVRLRQGWPEPKAARSTYSELVDDERDWAFKIAKREILGIDGLGEHHRSRFHGWIARRIAAAYKDLTGHDPRRHHIGPEPRQKPTRAIENTGPSGYGPGPRLVRLALRWIVWPDTTSGEAGVEKWLSCRRDRRARLS